MIPQGYSYVRIKAHPLSDTLMHKKLQMPSRFPFIMRLTSYCFNPAIVNSNYTEADKGQEVIKGWSSDLQRTSKSRVSAENISWQLIHCTWNISQAECGFYKIRQLLRCELYATSE